MAIVGTTKTEKVQHVPIKRLQPNPWQAEVGPPLSDQDFAMLKTSIERNGIQIPLIAWRHGGRLVVLSGSNRLGVAKELELRTVPVIIRQFADRDAAKMFALSDNLARRQLSTGQRAYLAYQYRETSQRGQGHRTDLHHSSQMKKVDSWATAAKRAGVSEGTVSAMKHIVENGNAELIQHIVRGSLSVPDAKRLLALSAAKQTKVLAMLNGRAKKIPILISKMQHQCRAYAARRFKANASPDAIQLIHCRFQELERKSGVKPQSAALVLTDIPYDKGFLSQLEDLALLAKRLLKPKGVLSLVCGQYHLPTVIAAFAQHLTWRWQGILVWQSDANLIYPLGITSQAKPILFFSRGDWQKRGRWSDVFACDGKEKKWHPHQQSLETMENLLDYLSDPGDLVVDPCGGSFTTAVACCRRGRRFIGCDVDPACVAIGRKRVTEVIHEPKEESA